MKLSHIEAIIIKACITLLLVAGLPGKHLLAGEVKGVRFWQDPEKTRIVFDLSDQVDYKIFSLSEPERLVLDIHQTSIRTDLEKLTFPKSLIEGIRSSESADKLRLVIDLKKKVKSRDFTLKPFQDYGHRLVVDLIADPADAAPKRSEPRKTEIPNNRDIVIAIDAGHGGEDPGAPGYKKTKEKDITLATAKKLADEINKEKGFQAFLTRTGDYYVSLRKRTEIARKHKADLFVSLHADGFPDKKVRGSSVWVLSPNGANSEMGRWLEQREQSSDLLGGVESLSDKDPLVAKVLIDLSMHYSIGTSIAAAQGVLSQLRKSMPKMHGKGLRKAAFVVLKMPDIPAMLVEMGFISNPQEEKLLKSGSHQRKIARSVASGIIHYFKNNPPDGSLLASLVKSKTYKVKPGDTLSEIAQRYGVSVSRLKSHNRLKSTQLKIGQMLTIPGV